MGSGKRSLTTAAMVLACACAVLSASGVAYASPTPAPTRTPTPTPTTSPAGKDLEAIRKKLDALYHDAAVATDAYNAAEEQAKQQSAEIVDLARVIVKGRGQAGRVEGPRGRRGPGAVPGRRSAARDAAVAERQPPAVPGRRGAGCSRASTRPRDCSPR